MTYEEYELLICLSEEAGEVSKVISKIQRFGFDSEHPFKHVSNKVLLEEEIGDFLGVLRKLISLGMFDEPELQHAAEHKLVKMLPYLRHENDIRIFQGLEL